jgi:hypothetical protein
MLLALAATALVALALLSDLLVPRLEEVWARHRARRQRVPVMPYDPGRERRAEQRARSLLRSCVNDEEWAMYRDLGFIRVWGSHRDAGRSREATPGPPSDVRQVGHAEYAYLIYPHRPIVAYVPQTHRLLNEYCVAFRDDTSPYGRSRLPDSDDVLAKWMALTGDERRLIETANMHVPGRQLDPTQVKRDLWRLTQWERARMRSGAPGISADAFDPHQLIDPTG